MAPDGRIAAINPLQWDGFDDVGSTRWLAMIEQLAEMGYSAVSLVAADERAAAREADLLQARGLALAPGYWEQPLRSRGSWSEELDSAQAAIDAHAAVGLDAIFVAAGMEPEREAAPDRFHDATMDEGRLQWTAGLLEEVGAYGAGRGVRVCLHQHVGTGIQSQSELESLLEATSSETVLLGPDSGHLCWARIDVPALLARHRDRVGAAHVKDVRLDLVARGAADGWNYGEAERGGAWAPLGGGSLDLVGILGELPRALRWLIVEVDHDPDSTPAQSSRISAEWLRANWLA